MGGGKIIHSVIDLFNEGDVGVEIGVADGTNARRLASTNPSKLYLVDCWEPQDPSVYNDPIAHQTARQQMAKYFQVCREFKPNNNVEIIREYSVNASKLFDDESFDWVYIDANHGYEAVKEDILSWYPKVKINGYISGHDWEYPWHSGVGKAVVELLGTPDYVNVEPSPSWIKKKP